MHIPLNQPEMLVSNNFVVMIRTKQDLFLSTKQHLIWYCNKQINCIVNNEAQKLSFLIVTTEWAVMYPVAQIQPLDRDAKCAYTSQSTMCCAHTVWYTLQQDQMPVKWFWIHCSVVTGVRIPTMLHRELRYLLAIRTYTSMHSMVYYTKYVIACTVCYTS